jgi:hypothetical protein
LIAEGCPNYRAILIREIQSIFEVKLSGETLRQITLELTSSRAAHAADPPAPADSPPLPVLEETTCSQDSITTPATIDAVLHWNYQQLAIPTPHPPDWPHPKKAKNSPACATPPNAMTPTVVSET